MARSSIPNVVAPLFSPDVDQQRVLDHTSGPLLVTGGAGTGKSAVLRERFARLIEGGADPERVALVVGSVGARDVARTALLDRLPASLPGLQVVTVHGLANRILREGHAVLGYAEPPQVLSAAEQFARVRELLEGEDPADWPAYGALLHLRGFVDEVRQFLVRAQEEMRTPESVTEAAERRGLTGWVELAAFWERYRTVMDDLNLVDFGALLQRAAAVAASSEPRFDHVLVDDLQDTTIAAEAILTAVRAPDLVAAADPEAHLFSFQGMSRAPLERFGDTFPGTTTVELSVRHRSSEPPEVVAWVTPHASEEHASVARELRRLRVEDGTAWDAMAVVVRRQGAHLGGLLRALDDARIPRSVPERGLSLTAEPATRPYVLALRWLVADVPRREELAETLLTSDVVGLSPAATRGLLRAARTRTGSVANALDVDEGLTPEEAAQVAAAREALAKASLFAGMSVQDAFRVLWEELPCSRRLVEAGGAGSAERRELDMLVTFAYAVAESEDGADKSVEGFLEALDAGEHGPGRSAWERTRPDAVRVLTAHGAVGREFDAVIVTGVTEGNFPSVQRPEPMFDLAVLDRVVTNAERNRERLQDERRLFESVIARARRRVVLTCADDHPDRDELTVRSRFVTQRGLAWDPAPSGPYDEPVSVREATAVWRRQLAGSRRAGLAPPGRARGARGPGRGPGTLVVPARLDRHGPTAPRDHPGLVLAAVQPRGLPAHARAGGRAGARTAGWVPRMGGQDRAQADRRGRARRDLEGAASHGRGARPTVAAAGIPSASPSPRRSASSRASHMLRNWYETYGERPALAIEQYFEFEFEGVNVIGYIDRIGAVGEGRHHASPTSRPARATTPARRRTACSWASTTWPCRSPRGSPTYKPVRTVELAFLRGNWKSPDIDFRKMPINERDEAEYQAAMRERLAELIRVKKALNETEVYPPNPYANCRFCDFKTLCPLYPEGQPVFPVDPWPAVEREPGREHAAGDRPRRS